MRSDIQILEEMDFDYDTEYFAVLHKSIGESITWLEVEEEAQERYLAVLEAGGSNEEAENAYYEGT